MKRKITKLTLVVIAFVTMFLLNSNNVKALTLTSSTNANVVVESMIDGGNAGDCTYIRAKKQDIVIDMGTYSKKVIDNLLDTSAYDEKNNTLSLDHLVITHGHSDHINGLQYIMDYKDTEYPNLKIEIDNLHLNLLFEDIKIEKGNHNYYRSVIISFLNQDYVTVGKVHCYDAYYQDKTKEDGVENGKDFYKRLMDKLVDVDDANIIRYTSAKPYNLGTNGVTGPGVIMDIVPPIRKYMSNGGNYIDVNNSSMIVVIRDNAALGNDTAKGKFKVIFPGDIEREAMEEMVELAKSGKYGWTGPMSKVYNKITYDNVIYKASHHGKRSYTATKFYNAEKELLRGYVKPTKVIATISKNYDTTGDFKMGKLQPLVDKGKIELLPNVKPSTNSVIFYYIKCVTQKKFENTVKAIFNYYVEKKNYTDDKKTVTNPKTADEKFREANKNFLSHQYFYTMNKDFYDDELLDGETRVVFSISNEF